MPGYPELNELVVCKIKGIKGYGAFVDLIEYEKEGFVHISQIASGWVKNIRSHVSEGQVRVGQVTNVDKEKGQVDVSFRRVNDSQEKRRISEYKRAKRSDKLLERAAQAINEDPIKARLEVGEPLKHEFGELYSAFEAMSVGGAEAVKTPLPKKWLDELSKIARESVKVPKVVIHRKLHLKSFSPSGAEEIKKALQSLEARSIKVVYVSAPDYQLSVTAADYPLAEKILREGVEEIEPAFKKTGELTIERAQK